MNRRAFLSSSLGAAYLSSFVGGFPGVSEALAETLDPSQADSANGPQSQFWNSFFDEVDPTKPHVVMRDSSQPVPAHMDPAKLPRYFHYDDKHGIRYAEKIANEELAKIDGSALVSVSLSGFHASTADKKKIGDTSVAQLQLHAVQTTPVAQYIAPLAWASLASIFHNNPSKLPSVEQLNFLPDDGSGSTSSVSRILYPKSEGKFAINVTLPPRDSMLRKILTEGLKMAQIASPLVSLPAISVPALRAFSDFYSTLQQNASFLLNSPLKDAVASTDAVNSPNMHVDALKLLNGEYVVIADGSTDGFSQQMMDYQLMKGYLVPKTLGANDDPMKAAQNSLTDITYATFKVTVEQATAAVTAETPQGAPAAAATSSNSSPGKSGSAKAPAKKP